MDPQTYPVSKTPHITVVVCRGSLTIEAWEEHTIELVAAGEAPSVRQEGDILAVEDAAGELRLRVPPATTAVLERLAGTLTVRGIQGSAPIASTAMS